MDNPLSAVLIIEDDEISMEFLVMALQKCGESGVVKCFDSREGQELIVSREWSLILLDLRMPNISGLQLLEFCAREKPEVPVIIVSGVDEIETAVGCMRRGAMDYLLKPVSVENLRNCLSRVQEWGELRNAVRRLTPANGLELMHPEVFSEIVTVNPTLKALFRYLEAIASSSQAILITGETGTGKDLIARAAHRLSKASGAFVPVNVAGLDDAMFSDVLFGHTRGAFTGADHARSGLLAAADKGTLFLDEIGDLSELSQTKLLRVLQFHEYLPLGSDRPVRTSARFIMATHCNLEKRVADGQFRRDLYFRCSTHRLNLPPLRERPEDLPHLIRHFVVKSAESLMIQVPDISSMILRSLRSQLLQGNIRELEGLVHDAVLRHHAGLPSAQGLGSCCGSEPLVLFPAEQLPNTKEVVEELLAEALRRTHGSPVEAAKLVGISRQALHQRMNDKNKLLHVNDKNKLLHVNDKSTKAKPPLMNDDLSKAL